MILNLIRQGCLPFQPYLSLFSVFSRARLDLISFRERNMLNTVEAENKLYFLEIRACRHRESWARVSCCITSNYELKNLTRIMRAMTHAVGGEKPTYMKI